MTVQPPKRLRSLRSQKALRAVSEFLFFADAEDARKILHEVHREYFASKVFAKQVTRHHKRTVADVYQQLDTLLRKLGRCIAR